MRTIKIPRLTITHPFEAESKQKAKESSVPNLQNERILQTMFQKNTAKRIHSIQKKRKCKAHSRVNQDSIDHLNKL